MMEMEIMTKTERWVHKKKTKPEMEMKTKGIEVIDGADDEARQMKMRMTRWRKIDIILRCASISQNMQTVFSSEL